MVKFSNLNIATATDKKRKFSQLYFMNIVRLFFVCVGGEGLIPFPARYESDLYY